ncbi:uncharacterized protein L3040_003259 [Drepanopeziza brunnea f. sp. 'multigermtubi']|uniref:Uncharacterized protein n=1 Tax=Marssonina brunnea f. sp. multigermtubi (strain MB_m1) TaxID=1072389 RepID=K1XTJ5_MARBU|nr:uncharacterized protein MBM_05895 [Drepanopeziza brunnea f. sp. 'multigermtubi' MB_m1]EKD15884.1 hypothetical protein MBM_05895 [Drepanopeziza brunnea f. sp. 'multigermtubi' MB_m1]KAJ5047432.1 hypothetical protein L3040_003259 [Drepanopeziza brunnea f. sp. 'multigermtubi']
MDQTMLNTTIATVFKAMNNQIAQQKCHSYGFFMRHLTRSQLDGIFWGLFCFQIAALVGEVQIYDRVRNKNELLKKMKASDMLIDAVEIDESERAFRRLSKFCLAFSFSMFLLLCNSLAMQIIAAQAILFCHQESLTHLYSPIWTVFALGITFATFGCCIQQMYHLNDFDLPGFGVALGTPILVISALSHYLTAYISQPDHEADLRFSESRSRMRRGDVAGIRHGASPNVEKNAASQIPTPIRPTPPGLE